MGAYETACVSLRLKTTGESEDDILSFEGTHLGNTWAYGPTYVGSEFNYLVSELTWATMNSDDAPTKQVGGADASTETETESASMADPVVTVEESGEEGSAEYSDESATQTYANARYGYSLSVPSTFAMGSEGANGDGVVFTDDSTGMTITVYGSNNVMGYTADDCLESLASGHDVHYQASEDDWVVVTYAEGGTVRYTKQFVGEGSMNTVAFEYPESAKDACDPVLEEVVASFSPGDLSAPH